MDIAGKRVLVTGSSRGIGFAIAEAFINAGVRAPLQNLSVDEEHELAACLEPLG